MPDLPPSILTEEVSEASRKVLLRALMLAPGDAALRRQLVARLELDRLIRKARSQGHGPQDLVSVTIGMLIDLSNTPAPKALEETIKIAAERGSAVGAAIFQYFAALRIGQLHFHIENDNLGHYTKVVLDEVSKSSGWFNNIALPGYRNVAHLWAALYLLENIRTDVLDVFELTPLPVFLSIAELIQRFAVKHIAMHQKNPIVSRDLIWWIPTCSEEHRAEADKLFNVWAHQIHQRAKEAVCDASIKPLER